MKLLSLGFFFERENLLILHSVDLLTSENVRRSIRLFKDIVSDNHFSCSVLSGRLEHAHELKRFGSFVVCEVKFVAGQLVQTLQSL